MRVGLFGARTNNAGLGTQTWEFFRYVEPECTMVLDYSKIDRKVSFPGRIDGPGVTHFEGKPGDRDIDKWLDDEQPDCVFTAETPYNFYLYDACRERGITTFCQYNYEFLKYLREPYLTMPDVLMAPTWWCWDRVQALFGERAWVRWFPVPVADDRFTKRRPAAPVRRFLHVAGYKLHADRNGTDVLMRAIPMVQSQDIEIVILSQHLLPGMDDPRVKVLNKNIPNYWDLYEHGDALLLPRRYGGLCLPCNEAMAAGLVVVMPEIAPNPCLIHPRCGFPVRIVDDEGLYPIADIDPLILATQIDRVAGFSAAEVAEIQDYQDARWYRWSRYGELYREFFAQHARVREAQHA